MDKTLKDKAIDFKGKKYVLVADRVVYFNEAYPDGSITTELVTPVDSNDVIVKATIMIPISSQSQGVIYKTFTGYSQATWGEGYINTTSALENAETSAVGRALAFMGIGVIESIASVDEIKKTSYPARQPKEIIDPIQAFQNAEKALRASKDLDQLNTVRDNIKKSKNIADDSKEELANLYQELTEQFDPTA